MSTIGFCAWEVCDADCTRPQNNAHMDTEYYIVGRRAPRSGVTGRGRRVHECGLFAESSQPASHIAVDNGLTECTATQWTAALSVILAEHMCGCIKFGPECIFMRPPHRRRPICVHIHEMWAAIAKHIYTQHCKVYVCGACVACLCICVCVSCPGDRVSAEESMCAMEVESDGNATNWQ